MIIIWQVLSLICMLTFATQNLVVKALTRNGVRVKFILWALVAVAVPFLLVAYLLSAPHQFLPGFGTALFFAVLGNILGFYGYVRAIRLADVSLVMPLLSLTPFFMLLTSWVMLAEFPDLFGLLGILGVVGGTYLLTRKPGSSGLEPFYALWKNPGCRWALLTSFVWSIQANIDKFGVAYSNPIGYTFWFHILFSVLLLPFIFIGEFKLLEVDQLRVKGNLNFFSKIMGGLILVGSLQALMTIVQMIAIMETQVSYVIAIKRSGMLFVVLFGGIFFDEKYTLRRFLAAVVVFAGLLGILLR